MTPALLFWQTSGSLKPFVFINLFHKWCISSLAWLELLFSNCFKYSAAESRPRLQPPTTDIRPVLEVEGLSSKFVIHNCVCFRTKSQIFEDFYFLFCFVFFFIIIIIFISFSFSFFLLSFNYFYYFISFNLWTWTCLTCICMLRLLQCMADNIKTLYSC